MDIVWREGRENRKDDLRIMEQSYIESKIRKLLALSDSDNPHEAANAAARAQRLITKYKIEKLKKAGDSFVIPEVRRQTEFPLLTFSTKKPTAWKWRLAVAVSRANHCQPWYGFVQGEKMVFCIGGAEDAAHAQSLFGYIASLVCDMRERDRPDYLTRGRKRSWNHAFETGASIEICKRLEETMREEKTKLSAAREDAVALQRINKSESMVSDFMAKSGMSLTKRVSKTQYSSRSAFEAGRQAGKSVNLGNTGQKALKGK